MIKLNLVKLMKKKLKLNKKIIFPVSIPYISQQDINSVNKSLKSGWISSDGPDVIKFEDKFSKFVDRKFSVAVSSGTAALEIAVKALGIRKNDEVLIPNFTIISNALAVLKQNAKPVLVDCNLDNWNININDIQKKITKKTKAIICPHIYGQMTNMSRLNSLKKKYNLFLIEDCAHAVESKYRGKHLGTFGDAGCFSFYSTKNLTTGEGGMILFKDSKLYNKAKIMSLHGLTKDAWNRKQISENNKDKNETFHYDVKEIGYKYNLTDLNASMGLVQLGKLEKNLKKRKILFNLYCKQLKNLPLKGQNFDTKKNRHGYHLFITTLDKSKTNKSRDDLFKYLTLNKIGCGINYRSVTDMTAFRKYFNWNDVTCPKSKIVGDNTISLPLYPTLKTSEVNYICKKIIYFFMN